MTDKPTDEALENLFVEETGFDTDDFPAAIFDFARAVLAKWGQPARAVEREQERIAFKDAHRHLELYEVPDAWGRPMFKHSHVEASWLGWIARASHGQAPATAQAENCAVCGHGNARLVVMRSCDVCGSDYEGQSESEVNAVLEQARKSTQGQAGAEPLSDEHIQDLLLCGDPTDEEMRLIRIGWDAAHASKGGQHDR